MTHISTEIVVQMSVWSKDRVERNSGWVDAKVFPYSLPSIEPELILV